MKKNSNLWIIVICTVIFWSIVYLAKMNSTKSEAQKADSKTNVNKAISLIEKESVLLDKELASLEKKAEGVASSSNRNSSNYTNSSNNSQYVNIVKDASFMINNNDRSNDNIDVKNRYIDKEYFYVYTMIELLRIVLSPVHGWEILWL